ncbi:FecR family protein [Cyclobacterium qasimii]|uniref:Iron dicitrate transporter FecR n=2 Tax=Cyclobacterium qasimii TaxID=1350429 RepID=A0A512C8P3_9BACT|nr:FecR family protein [Cyclobacterium qasimii]GEO20497.1 iron dicitrate transporter FecR [Cyclobacterium qasimii]
MKYKDYNIENFIMDDFFIQWVKHPNENNKHFWEKWLTQNPEKRDVVLQAIFIISSVKYQDNPIMDDNCYVETFENIIKAKSISEPKKLQRAGSFLDFSFPWRGIAAGLLILFCLGISFQMIVQTSKNVDQQTYSSTLIKRTNPAGKKSVLSLSDGTKIFLNSGSEISYISEFNDSIRLVSLEGEAFFEVQKEARPFVVETGQTQIMVLGTSFNVNKKKNGALSVALVTGKVNIKDEKGNQMSLSPSEMMMRDKEGALLKTSFDPLYITGWKDKVLVFKRNSFFEVKEKVENWFGVKILLQGRPNANMTYSGIYKDENLENVLSGIFLSSGLAFKIEDKIVTITNPI